MNLTSGQVMVRVGAGVVGIGALIGAGLGAAEGATAPADRARDHHVDWARTGNLSFALATPAVLGGVMLGVAGRPSGALALIGIGLLGGAATGVSEGLVRAAWG